MEELSCVLAGYIAEKHTKISAQLVPHMSFKKGILRMKIGNITA
jgi:hypothetical protein